MSDVVILLKSHKEQRDMSKGFFIGFLYFSSTNLITMEAQLTGSMKTEAGYINLVFLPLSSAVNGIMTYFSMSIVNQRMMLSHAVFDREETPMQQAFPFHLG